MHPKTLTYFALPLLLFLSSSSGDSASNAAQSAPSGLNQGPDLIAGDLFSLQQFGSSGTQVGLGMGTDSCNGGNQELNFLAMPNTDHPVMAQNLYRMSGGSANNERFEQIGQSWLAHGFFALQSNSCNFGCIPASGGTHLGVGCSNSDSPGLNAGQVNLGSRAWVNPFTGVFPATANSHTGHTHTGTAHRIAVERSDLDPGMNPGASYYAEAQFVTPNESVWCQAHPGQCNMENNSSYLRYNVEGTTTYVFSPVGSTVRMAPAIYAWTDAFVFPIEPAPGIDGRAFIGSKVTGPVAGVWHYEYAIYNQNLDRAIQSFAVPLGCGNTVNHVGFHAPANPPGFPNDGTEGDAGFSNEPWAATQTSNLIRWTTETLVQNPNANAIRWGTLYNFRFDSDHPPFVIDGTVDFFKTGTPLIVPIWAPNGCNATPAPTPPFGTPTPSPSPTPTATHFEVIAPAIAFVFNPFNFTVRALDQSNNTANNYTGTIHFTTTSISGFIPPDGTLNNGFGTFSADLLSIGIQTITATDTVNPSITGTSNNIAVMSDQPSPPPTPTPTATPTVPPCPGASFAENFDGAGPTPHPGSGWIISNVDPDSPPNDAFTPDGGNATLDFVGLTVTSPLAQVKFRNNFNTDFSFNGGVLEMSSPNISGGAFLDVTDSHVGGSFVTGGYTAIISNVANPLSGRMAWSGNSGGYIDTRVNLGPNVVGQTISLRFRFGSGSGGSGVGWRIDTTSSVGVCVGGSVTPTPGPATHFAVVAPEFVGRGLPFNITITAQDQFNNTATAYSGTVHFTSTDGMAVLPANSSLTNGSGTFSATLQTIGGQTITATDINTASITGTSNPISVLPVDPTPPPPPTPTPGCTPLAQEFGDITSLVPAGWFMQNNSQPGPGTTGWFQGNSVVFPAQSGANDSYIGANYNNGTGTSTLSNWLLTPPLPLQNGSVLTFWTRTVDTPAFPDRLQVRMSTNGASINVGKAATDVGDFDTLLLDINPSYSTTDYPNVWTLFTVTLSGLTSPTNGRLAFRYFVENGGPSGTHSDYIGIDTVQMIGCFVDPPTPTPSPTPTPTATQFPTPFPEIALSINAPSTWPVDTSLAFSVTVIGNGNTDYNNLVHFTSSDPTAELPPDTALVHGAGSFTATFHTVGSQTITATGFGGPFIFPGTSDPIKVTGPTPTPSASPSPSSSPTPTPIPLGHPINISTRLNVGTGDDAGIGGFIITGSSGKQVLIRGLGPSLGSSGISNPLADPVLELHGPDGFQTVINDNWTDGQGMIIPLPPPDHLEAALMVPLQPGAYTVILRGNGPGTGIGLVEIYDLTPGETSKLANISTRASVGTGDDVVIAGFVLGQGANDTVALRGIGPSLTGVPNALADPTLELRDSNGALLVANDDWQDDPAQALLLTGMGLAPGNASEAGMVTTLQPGVYTAILAGANSSSGVGLVELYDNPAGGKTP